MSKIHQVTNQPQPLSPFSLYGCDPLIQHWVKQFGGQWGVPQVQDLAGTLGQSAWVKKGVLVNQFTPELHIHDAYGQRRDLIKYHPAYHELMGLAIEHNIHAQPWQQAQ